MAGRNLKREKARARSTANLKRGGTHRASAAIATQRPPLTKERAVDFVKLLSAGLPQLDALSFFAPDYYAVLSEIDRRQWLQDWLNSALVTDAVTEWNKGKWEDLDDDTRQEKAIELAYNQMAYFLYAHSYHDVGGPDLKKWNDALAAIQQRVDAKSGQAVGAYDRFMQQLASDLKLGTPPQLIATAFPPEAVLPSTRES